MLIKTILCTAIADRGVMIPERVCEPGHRLRVHKDTSFRHRSRRRQKFEYEIDIENIPGRIMRDACFRKS